MAKAGHYPSFLSFSPSTVKDVAIALKGGASVLDGVIVDLVIGMDRS